MMNRRDFLKILSASSAALVLDPEKLLWVPGEKKIFLPPDEVLMTHTTILEGALGLYHDIVKEVFRQDPLFFKAVHKGRTQINHSQAIHLYQLVKRGGWHYES